MSFIKYFFVFIFLVLYNLICTPNVYGLEARENRTALGVSPVIVETILEPSKITRKEITIQNLTAFPLPIKTMVESFTPRERLEIPKEKLSVYDASSWISIDDNLRDFILQPKESRNVPITIRQNPKAAPGGHYASIIFQPLIPQQVVSQESVYVFARVSVLLFMQVKGDVVEHLQMQPLMLQKTYERFPATVNIPLVNIGNTHLRPTGRITVTDRKGTNVASYSFIPSIILPGTTKQFPVDVSSTHLPPGSYTIQAFVTYGTENKLLTSKTYTILLFPYKTLLIIVLPSLLFIVFVWRYRKRITKAIHVLRYGDRAIRRMYREDDKPIHIRRIRIRN